MPETTFRYFLKAVGSARSAAQAWESAYALVWAEGFVRLCVTLHGDPRGPAASVIHSAGFGAEAALRLDQVVARGPAADPAAALALEGGPPFRLSRLPGEDALSPARREALAALRAAAEDDLTVFAVFGPDDCDAVCRVGHPAAEIPSEAALHRIRAACQIAHLQALRTRGGASAGPALSTRELEVLRWIVHGKSNAAIAEILGCSAHTVDTHVRRIFAKLGVSDRTSASLRAVDRGLVAY